MNQILYTIENEEQKNKVKSIVLFFAMTIIIFGVIITAMGGYRIASSKAAKDEKTLANKIPNVTLGEQDNKVIISVNHVRKIKDIKYYWNNEEENVLEENTSEDITEEIEIPAGRNTLNLTVTDIEGKTVTKSQEFAYKGSYMDLSIIDNKSVKIVVTDILGLQSVTYKWGSEDEVTSYPDGDDTVIEITSDIPVGTNTIVVRAINKANNIETKEVTVQGITKPTMKITYNSDRTKLKIKLEDAQGIQEYSYTLSSAPIATVAKDGKIIPEFKDKLKTITTDSKDGNGQTSITEEVNFQEGFNYLEVTITNIEGVKETFTGWCAK